MWTFLTQVRILPLTINDHYLNTYVCKCDYSFYYFGETNAILIFVKSCKFIWVGVPEWLSGMTRNHVSFARAGSNPASHDQC